ncbi:MAG TPA: DUF6691 family protein [Polyangiaceae bacterium]|nr:DUF6691 family protein [Polyangiaceae bacterium]
MSSRIVLFGIAFGFVLSRAGATSYATIADMFTFRDLHLMGVIGVAVGLSAIGFAFIRRRGAQSVSGAPITLARKPMGAGVIPGSLLFGVGWALAGACPGTVLAQLGEGRVPALATLFGILVGTALAGRLERRTRAGRGAEAPKERAQSPLVDPLGTPTNAP